jgi:hypothetical protein
VTPGAYRARRSAKRWGTVIVIGAVAAMVVIRALSVRHRAGEEERSKLKSGNVSGDPSIALEGDAGSATRGDPFTVFGYTICAENGIEIDGSDGGGSVIVGDVHNNAREGAETRIGGANEIYGKVTSGGTVVIGSSEGAGPAVVHGSVKAVSVSIGGFGEVRHFVELDEATHGVDLNGNGRADDVSVGGTDGQVEASVLVTAAGAELLDGETDTRIADGTQPVEVGVPPPKPVSSPFPDFRLFYEMTTGTSTYPPSDEHVASEIPGDGGGHYFASASAFFTWLNLQTQRDVLCWRCSGDGKIDPHDATECPACSGRGVTPAVELSGVFYVDAGTLDLSRIETNLIVHGTIVAAKGNPYDWPKKTIPGPASPVVARHFPREGSIAIGGPLRMNFTQTYRAEEDGGPYAWRHRTIRNGEDEQRLALLLPEERSAMRGFPGLVAATGITIAPRGAGFASFAGDVGDEAITVLQGAVYAGDEIRLGGRGGWRGDPVVFDEEEARSEDDVLDESILRIDLDDDEDMFDLVKIADVSSRPVIRVARGRYTIDINNDGVLGKVVLGSDYGGFFAENAHSLPILVYHEGTLLGGKVTVGGQCAILYDPLIPGSAPVVGFGAGGSAAPLPAKKLRE